MKKLESYYIEQFNTGYFVDDIFIKWDTTYEDVILLLREKKLKESQYEHPNFTCSCNSILGLDVVSFNANGLPNRDKPILNISYDLPLNKLDTIDKYLWCNSLKKILGTPDYKQQENTNSWSSVEFYARWNLQSVEISLSVFGGAREVNDYLCGAAIFIEYKDIKQIARPFLAKSQQEENKLFSRLKETSLFSVFRLDKISPFNVPDYSAKDPNAALTDYLLRISQKALYKPYLLETPDFIKEKLTNNEFVIWQNKQDQSVYYCSTKWDTSVVFLKSKTNKILLCNVLPAKGSGGVYLDVNDLSLKDKYNSRTLFEAFELLEKLLDMKLSYHEEYDC